MDGSGTAQKVHFRDRESDCFLQRQEEFSRKPGEKASSAWTRPSCPTLKVLLSSDGFCCCAVTTETAAPQPFHSGVVGRNQREGRVGFRLEPVEPVNTAKGQASIQRVSGTQTPSSPSSRNHLQLQAIRRPPTSNWFLWPVGGTRMEPDGVSEDT